MKDMTLNKTWEECLRMWKWIVKQIDAGNKSCVAILKHKWLIQHGYCPDDIRSFCFFCQYACDSGSECSRCPGKIVSKRFDCRCIAYSYNKEPKKFYKKLLQLDAKRRSK